MNINDKMIRIMILAAEHGYITSQETQDICNTRMTAHRTLTSLKDFKFMDSFDTHLSPRVAYCLTSNGYKYLESLGKLKVTADSRFSKSDYNMIHFTHTVTGLQVRLLFEKYPQVQDYRSEKVVDFYNVIESKGSVRQAEDTKWCDAEVFIKGQAGEYKAGIEIELTSKSWSTLVGRKDSTKSWESIGVIRAMDKREDLSQFLWICSSELIICNIQSAIKFLLKDEREQKVKFSHKHYFFLLRELKLKGLEAPLYDVKGNVRPFFAADVQHQREQQALI